MVGDRPPGEGDQVDPFWVLLQHCKTLCTVLLFIKILSSRMYSDKDK